jgi:hypothetical protein
MKVIQDFKLANVSFKHKDEANIWRQFRTLDDEKEGKDYKAF